MILSTSKPKPTKTSLIYSFVAGDVANVIDRA
jgi:hypothetical protein